MADISISRGNTLPDSSAKADFHNLIDSSTLSLSEIVNADINTNAAIANSKLNLAAIAQAIAMTSKQFLFAKGADVASATSITLGTDGNCFDITGTTTIQTIAVKQAGSIAILHFDGALTLTDDTGNLELGGQDLTVAAEDEVVLKCDGTNWHLVSASTQLTSLDYEFVSTAALSNDATVVVTDLAVGYDYIFNFAYTAPQNDNDQLMCRMSSDNGSNYDAGAADYEGVGGDLSALTLCGVGIGNAANEHINCDLRLYNPAATQHTCARMFGKYIKPDTTTTTCDEYGGYHVKSAVAIDAIQFYMSTGNIASGTLNVFRRKLS